MKQYTIYFSGQALEGFSIDQVKQNLAKLFKLDDTKIARLFTGKPVIIKKNLDIEKAKQYQAALLKAGAKIQIKQGTDASQTQAPPSPSIPQEKAPAAAPKTAPSAPAQPATAAESADSSSSLSAGLAGLIGYNQHAKPTAETAAESTLPKATTSEPATAHIQNQAEPVNKNEVKSQTATSIENITPSQDGDSEPNDNANNGMTYSEANTGSFEEFMPPPAEFEEVDLSQYSMGEANSGSLEEFASRVPTPELPDTSYMDITDMNNRPLSDQSPKVKPVALPDIDELSMSEAESGDLSEFNSEIDAVELPDISTMTMSQAESGDLTEFETKKEAVPIPDISKLKME